MAVLIDEGNQFDVFIILEKFKAELARFYQFKAPINMAVIWDRDRYTRDRLNSIYEYR